MSRCPLLIALGGVGAVVWASGCLAVGADRSLASKTGTPATDIERGAPLEPTMSRVNTEPVLFAYPASEGGILVSTGRSVEHLSKTGARIDLGNAPGTVLAAASIANGQVLIAGSRGLFVFSGGKLEASPLGTALRRFTPTALLSMPLDDGGLALWIAGADSLHLWQAGRLDEIRPGDLPVSKALLGLGAPRGAAMPAWVASEGVLYGLIVGDRAGMRELSAFRELGESELSGASIDAIAADADGMLWLAAGGVLRKRLPSGVWQVLHEPANVTELKASPSAGDLWIRAGDGIWHLKHGLLRSVSGVPAGKLLSITADGNVLVGADSGLYLVEAGRRVELIGLDDGGSVINAAVEVEIRPELSASVSEISATLDRSPLPVERSPWRVRVDPAQLTESDHTLEIEVRYADSAILGRAKIRFRHTRAPTWSSDISKLYTERCSICHGPNGNAHLLNTAELWRADIERILEAVRMQKMPLAPNRPLDAASIERIQAWRAAGLLD